MKRVVFAVVGHPNKGKSSIVSTLSRNDSIEISGCSGTTSKTQYYPVSTAHAGYQLVDTPGFQRPTRALAWLNKTTPAANRRARAVADFVNDPQAQQQFPEEVELLRPIVKGAAILYVVDGSRPYGQEYEAEMEILRWTGRPSMALINPIENETCIAEWQAALAQYFKTVRVFNPLKADFVKQIDLLQAFAHLNPEWADTIAQVTQDLQQHRAEQKAGSALILARLLGDLCAYRETQKVLDKGQADQIRPIIENRYRHRMAAREKQAVKELFANYGHFQVDVELAGLDLPPDLFDIDQWYIWGLNKQQLYSAAAVTGAAAGVAVDVALAGHSLMLGALGGALAGLGSAWLGGDKLVNLKLQGLPLGGYEACVGPIENRNFPYVVVGRFLHLYHQISDRNHADRGRLNVAATDFQQKVEALEKSDQKALHLACEQLVAQKPVEELEPVLLPLF